MKKQLVKIISLFSVFVLLCCPMAHMFATALSESKDVIAGKVDEKVLSAFDDGAKTAKVYVWLNDIDQKQVDKAVEQKTGLRADNLAVIDENISNELATRIVSEADNDKLTTETEKMLQAYLDRTAAQRTQERERTDLYTATRRAEAKAKYNEKSASFLTKNSINSEKVIFNSNYAPMLILELTKQEINALAKREDVVIIGLYQEIITVDEAVTIAEGMEKTSVTRIKTVSGLTGDDVKLGIVDNYGLAVENPIIDTVFGQRVHNITGYATADTTSHVYGVATVMASSSGVAHAAEIYTVGVTANNPNTPEFESGYNVLECIELLLDQNVACINISQGWYFAYENNEPYYDMWCAWVDHIVYQHNVSIVTSAGNGGEYVSSPGLARNAITVGSYDIEFDANGNEVKRLESYSGYEELTGFEKPDVVALGEWSFNEGTSYAAPFVTGLIGLILELRPTLTAYPHILKAIIMASCHEKALPSTIGETAETMEAGTTEKQGAGIVNPYIAVAIASHGTYGFGIWEHDTATKDIRFLQPIENASSINVCMTWLHFSECDSILHSGGNLGYDYPIDIDFSLKSKGYEIGISTKENTSAEIVYANLNTNHNEDFTINATRVTNLGVSIKYAYAWSVNSMRFQFNNPLEGIGYLKNLSSGYYLEANTSTSTPSLRQNAFADTDKQMWIIRKQANSVNYHLQSAYDNIGAITETSSISSTSPKNITVLINNDGTCSIICLVGATFYALGTTNASNSEFATVQWQALSTDTVENHQKWYFEPCAYERGDIDRNGIVLSADARYILRASVNSETPNTIQSYLCDIDCDGQITAIDARLASRYSTNLDP